jgi:hypothetical protein
LETGTNPGYILLGIQPKIELVEVQRLLERCEVSRARNEELGKLLEVEFGPELSASDVDDFLERKIVKKLNYWYSTKMHVTGRGVIVNESCFLQHIFSWLFEVKPSVGS